MITNDSNSVTHQKTDCFNPCNYFLAIVLQCIHQFINVLVVALKLICDMKRSVYTLTSALLSYCTAITALCYRISEPDSVAPMSSYFSSHTSVPSSDNESVWQRMSPCEEVMSVLSRWRRRRNDRERGDEIHLLNLLASCHGAQGFYGRILSCWTYWREVLRLCRKRKHLDVLYCRSLAWSIKDNKGE